MAITIKEQIAFHSNVDGSNSPPSLVAGAKIAASQGTPIAGTPMYLPADTGLWKKCATSAGTDAIHGFLGEDITTQKSSGDSVRIYAVNPNHRYRIYAQNNAADAAESDVTVGGRYGMTVETTGEVGYTTVDINNANDVFEVVQFMSNLDSTEYATTDSPGVVLVKVLQSVIDQAKNA